LEAVKPECSLIDVCRLFPRLNALASLVVSVAATALPDSARRRSRVLLLDEGWSQTMYLAAALEDAGHDVTVLAANGITASHRRRTVQWCCGPSLASVRFLPHLDRMMRAAAFDHVLPLTEAAMSRLWDARPAWADRIYPAADDRQRRLLRDKHLLVEHMAMRGFSVPRQLRLDGAQGAAAIERELGMPLVVKGATGAGGANVRIVETAPQLARVMTRARMLGGAWAVQELVAGPTCLFGGLFHAGRPLRIYAAEKLAQHPPRTGPAIRLRSVDDPALIELGLRVFRELGWTGFASSDFIRRRDGDYVFLEVNPRLWGSVSAAASAGVDLFTPFAELLAGGMPSPDLAFVANQECGIFPRYLLSPASWRPGGAACAIRDLLGPQGQDWRDPGFVRHLAARLYGLCRHRQQL
jgi:glutathione synthase/RimK-type ligase-like ATP-grasp enzyme